MFRLRLVLGNWYHVLHMRKMLAAYGDESTIQQRQIWLLVDSRIRDKEEPILRTWGWSNNASILYHEARDMLRKAKLPKNGSCETILERWQKDADYQKSLSAESWTEEKKSRVRRTRSGRPLLSGNTSRKGTVAQELEKLYQTKKEYTLRQDHNLISVKRSALIVDFTKHMLKVPDKETSQSIHPNKEDKILNNNLMVTRSTPSRFTLELDGDIILQPVRLHPRSGSRTMSASRIKVGIIGDLQPGLNSKKFKVEVSTGKPVAPLQTRSGPDTIFSLVQVVVFRLRATFRSQAIDGGREQNTFRHCMYRHRHFVRASHMISHAHAWLKSCLPLKAFPYLVICLDRHVVWSAQPSLLFSTLSYTFRLLLNVVSTKNLRRSTRPWRWRFYGIRSSCRLWGDKMVGDKTVIDIFNPIVTEQEGARSAENQVFYSTEGSQTPEIDDKFSLPCNQSLLSSTQGPMEKPCHTSRGRLGKQIRFMLTSPRYLPERSKCGTITHLSLWRRRFDVKIVSKSELFRHRETCGVALTSEKNGRRRLFWKRATCWRVISQGRSMAHGKHQCDRLLSFEFSCHPQSERCSSQQLRRIRRSQPSVPVFLVTRWQCGLLGLRVDEAAHPCPDVGNWWREASPTHPRHTRGKSRRSSWRSSCELVCRPSPVLLPLRLRALVLLLQSWPRE